MICCDPSWHRPHHTGHSTQLSTIRTLGLALQLGQLSVNPPGLVLEVGGTSTKQAAMPGELKSPPTWNLEVGGTSTLQAQLPARLKSPPLQAQVRGGSRWADLAVDQNMKHGRVQEVDTGHWQDGNISSSLVIKGMEGWI